MGMGPENWHVSFLAAAVGEVWAVLGSRLTLVCKFILVFIFISFLWNQCHATPTTRAGLCTS